MSRVVASASTAQQAGAASPGELSGNGVASGWSAAEHRADGQSSVDHDEIRRFTDHLAEIRREYADVIHRNALMEEALASVDRWGVPEVEGVDGSYDYVPLQVSEFIGLLLALDVCLRDDPDFKHSVRKYRPFSFLEIGCGIGRNLNIVRSQTLLPVAKAVGFDHMAPYVDAARQLFGFGEEVFVQDCMTFDYAAFDVIYFYRPFNDEKAQKKFEKYLISSMKTGAILLAVSPESLDRSRQMMRWPDSHSIFKRL